MQRTTSAASDKKRLNGQASKNGRDKDKQWLGLEDAAKGAKFLEESIAYGGDATAAKQQLARAYFLLGKFGDAAKVLQLLIDDTPGHVSASATLFG